MNRLPTLLPLLGFVLLIATVYPSAVAQVGGNDGDVQYNNNGSAGGASGVEFDDTSGELTTENLNNSVFVHANASGGTGTSGDPWTLTTSEWSTLLTGGRTVRAVKGYYEMPASDMVTLPSDTALVCDSGATFVWPGTGSVTADAMFFLAADAANVVIENCRFEPGITMPQGGEVGGQEHHYILVGTTGSSDQANFTIRDNEFIVGRYPDPGQVGGHIEMRSGTKGVKIHDNEFGPAPLPIQASSGHSTAQYHHESLEIYDNRFDFPYFLNNFSWSIHLGAFNGPTKEASFDVLKIHNNTFRNAHSIVLVTWGGDNFSMIGNSAVGTNPDLLLQRSGVDPIRHAIISDNICQKSGSHGGNCSINAGGLEDFVVSGNSLQADEIQISVSGSKRGVVTGNLVRGDTFSIWYEFDCFVAGNSEDIIFAGNNAVDCAESAFDIANSSGIVISNNAMIQTTQGMIDEGIKVTGTCTDCTAVNNHAVGLPILGGWTADPTDFVYHAGNISDPAVAGPLETSGGIGLSNGTGTTVLNVHPDAGSDYTYTLPVKDGGWGQAISTNGEGTLMWRPGEFYSSPPIDTFPTSETGEYTDPETLFSGPRDLNLYATETGTGTTVYSSTWSFDDIGVKSGTLEVWHRLYKDSCNATPGSIASQTIYYSTDGSDPTTAMGTSDFAGTDLGFWAASRIELTNQDMADLKVKASYVSNNSDVGVAPPARCRGHVGQIVFNEADTTLRATRTPVDLELDGSVKVDGNEVVSGTGSDAHGVALWGDPGQGTSADTGDEVCSAAGLTCVTTFSTKSVKIGGGIYNEELACSSTHTEYYTAMCK